MSNGIPQPKMPKEPEYEDLSAIPDQPHQWTGDWESGIHDGRTCGVCGKLSECTHCDPSDLEFPDCLREQARERNLVLKEGYTKAKERYEAQMDYWREIVDVAQELVREFAEYLTGIGGSTPADLMDYPRIAERWLT